MHSPETTVALVTVILVALTFDFLNGFHDAANSIATVVSTGALSPRKAVAWAAFFNFAAVFLLGTRVAETVGHGMIDLAAVTIEVILAGLIGAIAWNLFTWYFGLPISSSHALIGGYAGAAIAKAGVGALIPAGWLLPLLFIIVSPLIGVVFSFTLTVIAAWAFRRWSPPSLDRLFARLQLFSAALYSLGHGGNDAQKTMGILTGILVATGHLSAFVVPTWVLYASHAVIAFGTLFGGWRIVRTMGTRITRLRSFGGFCAETSGAVTILGATLAGIPVSTTHTITGAIVGAGATHRLSSVHWPITGRILWAWILTIPVSAAIAAACYGVVRLFT